MKKHEEYVSKICSICGKHALMAVIYPIRTNEISWNRVFCSEVCWEKYKAEVENEENA
jgi:hypothetical protein